MQRCQYGEAHAEKISSCVVVLLLEYVRNEMLVEGSRKLNMACPPEASVLIDST